MPTAPSIIYGNSGILPKHPGGRKESVALPPSIAYAKGQVLAEKTGVNEVQTLTLTTGGTLGGTYTLSFGGVATGNIAFNATAATVQADLQALSTIGASNVAVTGTTPTTSGGTLTITFQNALGNQNVAAIVADGTNLTGTTPGAAITTGTAGSGAANTVQTVYLTGSPTGGTFTLTYGGQTTAGIAYNAAASDVQTALAALSSIGVGNVSVAGAAGGPWNVTFVGSLADQSITAMTTSYSGLTGGSSPTSVVAVATAGSAGTPGLFYALDTTQTDGRQTPRAILQYDCATDASGNVTFGPAVGSSDWGATRPAAPAWFTGYFETEDVVGLTDAAITAAGWRLISGTAAHGILCLPGAA